MIKLGLTGSIGMGKSTVASMFEALGAMIWDADSAVHHLYEKGGAAVVPIGEIFADVVVDGAIDRTRLAAHVLRDEAALRQIEEIVHPLVQSGQGDFVKVWRASGVTLAVFDIPLLFEHNRQSEFDAVALVLADTKVRRARVMARPGMNAAKYEKIISLQMPDAEKKRYASYIIRTDCTLEETQERVKDIYEELLRKRH